MNNFRTLDLAISLYEEINKLKLGGVLQNQFDRSLLSICLNLAEGSARPTSKDRRKFYYISYSSLKEVSTILKLRNINKYNEKISCLAAHIWKLAQNPGGY